MKETARRERPIEEETGLSRRRFLVGATVTTAVVATGIATAEGQPSKLSATKVGRLSQLQLGKPVDFSYPEGYPALLIKLGERARGGVGPQGRVVAFSRTCTHKGCPLAYDPQERSLRCPCHQSHFSPSAGGFVTQGPAPRWLPRISLQVRGDEIWATGVTTPPFPGPITLEEIGKIYGIPEVPAKQR